MNPIRQAERIARGGKAAEAADLLGQADGVAIAPARRRGRAASLNPSGRFEAFGRTAFDDGWNSLEDLAPFKTEVQAESARTIITRNQSPDLSFDRSVNPYRGCEHGCAYCYARPTHANMGLSPGLDFEAKLFAKPDAAKLLEKELAKPGYEPRTIALGTNTDPYQPVEKQWQVTRGLLEVLDACSHPVGIVTKGSLVTRDIDILSRMAERGLVKVAVSLTTLDRTLSRAMEPRAAAPERRLEMMRSLSDAGIPVSVLAAPIIPGLNDGEVERLLESAHAAGAREAGYVLLRLPLEVAPLFQDWLMRHYPDRFRHVMSLIRSMRGGRDYDADWATRMKGTGPYAWQIGRRFEMTARRLGLNTERTPLRTDLFSPPGMAAVPGKSTGKSSSTGDQLQLF